MLGNAHIVEIGECHIDHSREQLAQAAARYQKWQIAFMQQLRSRWTSASPSASRRVTNFSCPANIPEETAQRFLDAVWAKGGWQDEIEARAMLVLASVMIDDVPRDSNNSDDFWLLDYPLLVRNAIHHSTDWTCAERVHYNPLVFNAASLARAVVDEEDFSLVDEFPKTADKWWLRDLIWIFCQK